MEQLGPTTLFYVVASESPHLRWMHKENAVELFMKLSFDTFIFEKGWKKKDRFSEHDSCNYMLVSKARYPK